ncbi:hypothetical protein Tco_0453458 [Tanacetum coccineum]
MTHSIVKKLKEPPEEPESELHRRRKANYRQQQNESLAILGRNLFDNEASSSANSGPKPTPPLKAYESIPPPFQLIFYDNFSPDDQNGLNHFIQYHFSELNEDEGCNGIEEYIRYQDNTCEEPAPMNISCISKLIKPTLEGQLKKAQE